MQSIDLQDIPTAFLPIVQRAADGETIVICRENQPVVEMRPTTPTTAEDRPLGLAAGKIEMLPGFFDPLPEELTRAFGIWKDRNDISTDSAMSATELRRQAWDRSEIPNDDSR